MTYRKCFTDYEKMDNSVIRSSQVMVHWLERYIYGSETPTGFNMTIRKLLPTDGVIRRRDPDTGDISKVIKYFCLNFDTLKDSNYFSPDNWFNALEVDPQNPKKFQIDYDGLVKLYIASHSEKWVLKGPLTLFFLLSYYKKPFVKVNEQDFQEFEEFVKLFLKFHDLCVITEKKIGRLKYSYISPALLVPKSRIKELWEFSKHPEFLNSPLSRLVEESWELIITDQNEFSWKSWYIRDSENRELIQKWSNHSRIRRTTKVGKHFYLNDTYRHIPKVSQYYYMDELPVTFWDSFSIEPPVLPKTQSPIIFKNSQIDLTQDYPNHPIHRFLEFYKTHFNTTLKVIQVNNGVVLCRETNKNHPKDVIVKIISQQLFFRGYGIGYHLMDTLLHGNRNNIRFFTYEPQAYIREEGIEIIRKLHDDFHLDIGVFQYITSYFILLHNQHIMNLDLLYGGFLKDYTFQEDYFDKKRYLTNILRFFLYNEDSNGFKEVPYDLEAGIQAYEDELERRRKIVEGKAEKKRIQEEKAKERRASVLEWEKQVIKDLEYEK